MPDLLTLSDRHRGFYAPAFAIKVGGRDLQREIGVAAPQVEVDRALSVMGRFSFSVVNCYDMKNRRFVTQDGGDLLQVLAFGSEVEIAVGYGDRANLTTILRGMITEIGTTFPDAGVPELSVSGYDHLFPLSLGKISTSYRDRTDSEVVDQIARENRLGSSTQSTSERHAQIEMNQQSQLDFVKTLAERNHFEFYADENKQLHFAKPNDGGEGVVTLSWGESLLSFKPEANLAAQVSSVVVYGWDPERKQAIVGRATAGEESGHDPRRSSGGQRVRQATGKSPVLEVRQPVFTEAEARRRAQAILNDHAKTFLTGDAECIGLPELLPDRNVTFGHLGEPFSKTYYIQQTVHKVDQSGYRTRVKVKEPSL
jgi:uncharacterized protein